MPSAPNEPEPLAPPGFTVAFFPMWTLADAGRVMEVTAPDVGRLLVLFTDDDLARRFAEDVRITGAAPYAIPDRAALLGLLEWFQHNGVKHVGIDVSFRPWSAQLHPIGAFVADVSRGG